MGTHFIDKEMNLERLRNLLKTTQLENRRVKNRSYLKSCAFYHTILPQNLIKKYWLVASLSLFFFGPNRRYLISRSKLLFVILDHSSQVSQSKELFCSLKIKQKQKQKPTMDRWVSWRMSPEVQSLRGEWWFMDNPSCFPTLRFGLCALGEREWKEHWAELGDGLPVSRFWFESQFFTCKMMKSSWVLKL